MRAVPLRHKYKFINRHRSDPHGFIFSSLRFLKRRAPSLRRHKLTWVKYLARSSFYPFKGSFSHRKFFLLRRQLRYFYRYRFPRFARQRRSRPTVFSKIFSIKQQFKKFYGFFKESQFSNFLRNARKSIRGERHSLVYPSPRVYQTYVALEHRLFSILRRSYFFLSPFEIRQAIVHGHILVNGAREDVPNRVLVPGDIVTFSAGQRDRIFANVAAYFRTLKWISARRFRSFRKRHKGRIRALRDLFLLAFKRRIAVSRLNIFYRRDRKFARAFKRAFFPSHLDIDFSLPSVALLSPVRLSTIFFPTVSARKYFRVPSYYHA